MLGVLNVTARVVPLRTFPLFTAGNLIIITTVLTLWAGLGQKGEAQTITPRFGRSYGMFGERVLGQPIRPPQPRFSQGIERTPDGTFQGVRPPGSAGYPRSEATRQAREFRYREWLTPEGNWVSPSWEAPPSTQSENLWLPGPRWQEGLAMPPSPEVAPVLPPEASSGNTLEAASSGAVSGESATGEAQLNGSVPSVPGPGEAPPELPAPSRWVNSVRAPRTGGTTLPEVAGRETRLLTQTNWRQEIQRFLQDVERRRVFAGEAWESHLATRVSHALGSASAGSIRVRVEGGRAFLQGKVTSREAAQLAARILLLEPGVWEVVNQLEVTSP